MCTVHPRTVSEMERRGRSRCDTNVVHPKSDDPNMEAKHHRFNWSENVTPNQALPHTIHIPLCELVRVADSTSHLNMRNVPQPQLNTPACVSIPCLITQQPPPIIPRRPGDSKDLLMTFRRIARRVAISPPADMVVSIDEARRSPRRVSKTVGWFARAKKFIVAECNRRNWVIDPHGFFCFFWMLIVSMSYVYNLIVIPLRTSFHVHTAANIKYWRNCDVVCDVIYLMDLVLVKPRISYLDGGMLADDLKRTSANYMRRFMFKMDLVSLLPVDYIFDSVAVRFLRLLKWQTFACFNSLLDKRLSAPLISRVARTLIYTFYMIHLNACGYYKMSDYEGIGSNGWVYNGEGNPYIRCFYFATKTSTSIGKLPKPENDVEYVYMTFAWLMGVCVFALLVGQIRYFIITGTKSQTEYRKLLAETTKCMRQLNIPSELQMKVTSWFEFTWKQQRTLDDSRALMSLPINLKTELAIQMHIDTLNKVKLFTDCEEALLRDLVLKLRSVIYTPGDMICRKGDVGREMYILKRGQVQVLGGPDNNQVLATLGVGSVFGEISLLNIKGVNRRTANVRSTLFSNLFVLSKNDFNSVLAYYPDAQELLFKRANDLVNMNAAREKTTQEIEDVPEKGANEEETEAADAEMCQIVVHKSDA